MSAKMKEKLNDDQIEIKSAVDFGDKGDLLKEVLRVEKEAWPEEIRAMRDKFESRLEVFPEGFFLAFVDSKLAGVSTSEIINLNPWTPPTSWEQTTDEGYIRRTHRNDGNTVYVVSIGVSDWAQGRGLGTKLLDAQKRLVKEKGLRYLALGSRIPGYREYHSANPAITAQEYAKMADANNEPLDPEVRFYARCGFEIAKVAPNYMGDDPESENYGVVMIWEHKT
jgi:ribosomal protein S18 acetylase RimI-like enzyme